MVAKLGVDTAEKEPSEVGGLGSWYMYPASFQGRLVLRGRREQVALGVGRAQQHALDAVLAPARPDSLELDAQQPRHLLARPEHVQRVEAPGNPFLLVVAKPSPLGSAKASALRGVHLQSQRFQLHGLRRPVSWKPEIVDGGRAGHIW